MAAPRSEPLSRPRIAATLLVLAAVVAGILAIPLPWHVESPFYVEPQDVAYVQTSVAGSIERIHVQPGETVKKGDSLIDLVDPDKERRLQELQTQFAVQTLEIKKQEALDNHTGILVAERQRHSIEEQIQDFEKQIEMLRLKAPAAGVVVAMPRVEEPASGVETLELRPWHGSPLDETNVGAMLEPRTPVLCIAPNSNYQVILLVDQQDRGDLNVGDTVEIRFDELPGQIWEGKISKISPRHAEFAPPALSNKTGGDLATVSDRQGRERLSSSAYEAVVVLDKNTAMLRSGLRGRSRFAVGHRSTWQLIFRWLRHTFHFKI